MGGGTKLPILVEGVSSDILKISAIYEERGETLEVTVRQGSASISFMINNNRGRRVLRPRSINGISGSPLGFEQQLGQCTSAALVKLGYGGSEVTVLTLPDDWVDQVCESVASKAATKLADPGRSLLAYRDLPQQPEEQRASDSRGSTDREGRRSDLVEAVIVAQGQDAFDKIQRRMTEAGMGSLLSRLQSDLPGVKPDELVVYVNNQAFDCEDFIQGQWPVVVCGQDVKVKYDCKGEGWDEYQLVVSKSRRQVGRVETYIRDDSPKSPRRIYVTDDYSDHFDFEQRTNGDTVPVLFLGVNSCNVVQISVQDLPANWFDAFKPSEKDNSTASPASARSVSVPSPRSCNEGWEKIAPVDQTVLAGARSVEAALPVAKEATVFPPQEELLKKLEDLLTKKGLNGRGADRRVAHLSVGEAQQVSAVIERAGKGYRLIFCNYSQEKAKSSGKAVSERRWEDIVKCFGPKFFDRLEVVISGEEQEQGVVESVSVSIADDLGRFGTPKSTIMNLYTRGRSLASELGDIAGLDTIISQLKQSDADVDTVLNRLKINNAVALPLVRERVADKPVEVIAEVEGKKKRPRLVPPLSQQEIEFRRGAAGKKDGFGTKTGEGHKKPKTRNRDERRDIYVNRIGSGGRQNKRRY